MSYAGLPILIIDDSEDDVFLLTRLLQRAGVKDRVTVLSDGLQAVSFLQRAILSPAGDELPAICFLDINLPGLSGLEILEWIRTQQALERMPVVMLSSSEDPLDVARAAGLGAQCYLTKCPAATEVAEVLECAARQVHGEARHADVFAVPSNRLLRKR